MVRPYITFIVAILCFLKPHAQLFQDVTAQIGGLPTAPARFYGGGISFYDVNEDGFDDLTIPVTNDTLELRLSNSVGFEIIPLFYVSGEMKMPLWGDYDNDGDNDIYVPVYLGQSRLFRNEGNWNFTDVTFDCGINIINNWKCFGANWLDYNNDGWLDLFQTVYTENLEPPRNFLLRGSASGLFTDVSISTGIRIGSAWSLSACVADFDHDGDQDIHVANDKATFDAFLVNAGPWFVNLSESMGFNIICNSMSSSVSDYDHDGEYDIFVSNTINLPNLIYKKNINQRYDPWVFPQIDIDRLSWGGLWIDANNDSWDELHISHEPFAGDQQAFYYNISGDLQRENFTSDGATEYTYAMAKGDFNGDGYYDMASAPDDFLSYKLYRNLGGLNNFVRVRLEGGISNRSGIGVLLKYWIDGEEVIRYSRSSDAFMTQDSQWMILGMGSANAIDSLSVRWLGGVTETYYNIQANQHIVIREGNPLSLAVVSEVAPNESGVVQLCNGDSTVLSSSNAQSVLWSTGAFSPTIAVSSSGNYSYSFVDPLNETHSSDPIAVEVVQNQEPLITLSNPSCWNTADGSIHAVIAQQWSALWNEELHSDSLLVEHLSEGDFSLQVVHELGCAFQTTVTLLSPDTLSWTTEWNSVSCFGADDGSVFISDVQGGTGMISFWLDSVAVESQVIEGLSAGSYQLLAVDENNCAANMLIEIETPEALFVEAEVEETEGYVEFEISGGSMPYVLILNDSVYSNWNEIVFDNHWNHWSVADANGCAVADSFFIAPQVIIQALEIQEQADVFVFLPNGRVVFKGTSPILLTIFDGSGKMVFNKSSLETMDDLSHLSSGIYFASWMQSDIRRTRKFIID